MSEKKKSPTVNPFNRNQRQEGKSSSSGKVGSQTISATHLVNIQRAAKQMPKTAIKQPKMNKKQKKG